MTDDLTPLTSADHWLGWLGDDPGLAVRDEIEGALRHQVPTATLDWLRLHGKPYFLTGIRKLQDDPETAITTRAALAVAFELEVRSEGKVEQLNGVFSWVAAGLDGERRDRVYFDLGADMEWASEQLKGRIFQIDTPLSPPGAL